MSETLTYDNQDQNNRIRATWNAKFANDPNLAQSPPLPFTGDIINFTKEHLPPRSHGLYIGHGSGRNFSAMVEQGLQLDGVDVSDQATKQLRAALPYYPGKIMTEDYRNLTGSYDYLVSLQAFHFGNSQTSHEHFAHAARLLNRGGYLFLQTHAASTVLDTPHRILEGTEGKSRTVIYSRDQSGSGIHIHYYEKDELESMAAANGFSIIAPLRETQSPLLLPHHGMRSEWETIWQKAA
jgi:hypothetical protein